MSSAMCLGRAIDGSCTEYLRQVRLSAWIGVLLAVAATDGSAALDQSAIAAEVSEATGGSERLEMAAEADIETFDKSTSDDDSHNPDATSRDVGELSPDIPADPFDASDDGFVGPPAPEVAEDTHPRAKSAKPPIAANIDLSEPVAPMQGEIGMDIGQIAPPVKPELVSELEQQSLILLGSEVAAGTSTRLAWSPEQSFAGIAAPTPVLVVNGEKPGPVLCITAAIHGDELNGIEVVRRVLYDLHPGKLSGAVIGVPIVNLQGFRRASRYLPDRRDLNRYFPGNPTGSSASRLAYSFFKEVISHCSALVDLHTGSFQRTNLPQLRADLDNPQVLALTQGFGSTVVLHSAGVEGTLRRAASDAGIPTVTLEAGGPARVQYDAVTHGAKGVMTLLNELGMYSKVTLWGNREPVYYRSRWVRADRGGVLFSKVELGDRVSPGQLLGTITDPITNVQSELRASTKGRVLGMALDQFVMPGFAAFRLGIETADGGASSATAIDAPGNSGAAETAGDDEESPSTADLDEYEEYEDDQIPDVRDSLEDSE